MRHIVGNAMELEDGEISEVVVVRDDSDDDGEAEVGGINELQQLTISDDGEAEDREDDAGPVMEIDLRQRLGRPLGPAPQGAGPAEDELEEGEIPQEADDPARDEPPNNDRRRVHGPVAGPRRPGQPRLPGLKRHNQIHARVGFRSVPIAAMHQQLPLRGPVAPHLLDDDLFEPPSRAARRRRTRARAARRRRDMPVYYWYYLNMGGR